MRRGELAVRKRFTRTESPDTRNNICKYASHSGWSYATVACVYVSGESERGGYSLINIERGRDNFN